MRSRFAAIVCAVGVALTGIAGPATGTPAPLIPRRVDTTTLDARDPDGDVHVYGTDEISPEAETSIDIHELTVEARGATTRFTITLQTILLRPSFDQMVFIDLRPAPGSTSDFVAGFGVSTRARRLGYAFYEPDEATPTRSCRPEQRVETSRHRVVVDVPRRCLPRGPVFVQLKTKTGIFRSDAPVLSQDKLYPATAVSVTD